MAELTMTASICMYSQKVQPHSSAFVYSVYAGVLLCFSLCSTGLGVNAHLMYVGECSPKNLRGLLTLTPSIFIGLGKVVGQIIGIK